MIEHISASLQRTCDCFHTPTVRVLKVTSRTIETRVQDGVYLENDVAGEEAVTHGASGRRPDKRNQSGD